jgi:hypothetical protein
MDEEDKIQAQLNALAKAQAALLNQDPPDIDAFQQLSSLISDLQFRLLALSSQPQIPQLNAEDVATLQVAEQRLAAAINASAGATQVLQAATALAKG